MLTVGVDDDVGPDRDLLRQLLTSRHQFYNSRIVRLLKQEMDLKG
jgi:hypothetical protein